MTPNCQARSSGGERYLDVVEVGGSKPPVPIIINEFLSLCKCQNIPFKVIKKYSR